MHQGFQRHSRGLRSGHLSRFVRSLVSHGGQFGLGFALELAVGALTCGCFVRNGTSQQAMAREIREQTGIRNLQLHTVDLSSQCSALRSRTCRSVPFMRLFTTLECCLRTEFTDDGLELCMATNLVDAHDGVAVAAIGAGGGLESCM